MERAVDWLFSHAGDAMPAEDEEMQTSSPSLNIPSASGKYKLRAFISHRGTSAACGHYVAHVLVGDRWVLFNDEKVVEVLDIEKSTGEGYVYFYSSE